MIVQVAVLDETNKVFNIIAVDAENVNADFLDPFVDGIGATSWLDLRKNPYPWDWEASGCTWDSVNSAWVYPEGFTNETPIPEE